MTHIHEQTPLLTGLVTYAKKPLPFHIPGHKRGKGMDEQFRTLMGAEALALDLINLAPLDDLHHPQGMIADAQSLPRTLSVRTTRFFQYKGQVVPL